MEQLRVFDVPAGTHKVISSGQFKDQDLVIWSAVQPERRRDDDIKSQLWLGTNAKFFITRTSRDLHRIDVCEVEVNDTSAKTLIQERLNTYVEVRPLGLVDEGRDLIEWSERDAWAHVYIYDVTRQPQNQINLEP